MSRIVRGPRPQDQFTMVANAAARDARLPWESLGLLTWLLSHEEGWETSERRIAELRSAGRKAVRNMIAPLEEAGYLVRDDQARDGHGQFGHAAWYVTDMPGTVVPEGDHGRPATATVVSLTDRGASARGGGGHKEEQGKEDDEKNNARAASSTLRLVQEEAAPPSDFEQFWVSYPRIKGKRPDKKRARDAWAKLSPSEREMAMVAVPEYARWCEETTTQPKYAVRYLTYEAYLDHLPGHDDADDETHDEPPRPHPAMWSDHSCSAEGCVNGWVLGDDGTVTRCPDCCQPGMPVGDSLPSRRDLE